MGNPSLYRFRTDISKWQSADDAPATMAFYNIIVVNRPLKVRWPKDYGGPEFVGPGTRIPAIISANVPDSIHRTFIKALPTRPNEERVMEPLENLGELEAFNLVRENRSGSRKVWLID